MNEWDPVVVSLQMIIFFPFLVGFLDSEEQLELIHTMEMETTEPEPDCVVQPPSPPDDFSCQMRLSEKITPLKTCFKKKGTEEIGNRNPEVFEANFKYFARIWLT